MAHELVHAFQYDITTPRGARSGGIPGAARLPLWFIEGMAEYLSLGPIDPHTAMWLRDAVRREEIPDLDRLDDPDFFPYRYGHAFWAYVAGRWGDGAVVNLLSVAANDGIKGALKKVLGISAEELSRDWKKALNDQYEPILSGTQNPDQFGRELISKDKEGGRINVGPVLSPDGTKIAFFSERDLFAIDIFIADAKTGEILRKVTDTAVDPHFDSFQWVYAAGAWSPDSRRFGFTSVASGRPQLSIYDFPSGDVVQRIRFDNLGEIQTPAWAPDSNRIVFSGMEGGFTDLYIVNLTTEEVTRLNNDAFAQIQPAWSPDGNRIVFVADQYTTSLDNLDFGQYRLATIDPASRSMQQLTAFNRGKHINPQWAPSSSGVYFISDQDGISNVYLLDLGSGRIQQLTNLRTGASGISALSPALAVADRAGTVAFNYFADDQYKIFLADPAALRANTPTVTGERYLQAAALPPLQRETNAVAALLERPQAGLAPARGFEIQDYRPSLKLDYVAPPSIGVGMTNYGGLVGGGTALYFSDMLGHHNLMTAFQTSSTMDGNFLNNLSVTAAYTNQKNRWDWGVVAGQVPYLLGGYQQGLGEVDGELAILQRDTLFWQIERQAAFIFAYPFNRTQRLEFSTGYSNISFDAETRQVAISQQTGQLLLDQREDIEVGDPLHMGTASAALVYDTSIFAGTSPVAGQRYRLEMGTSQGSLSYTTALADYRRYIQLTRSFSLAGRLLHFGRYGGGAEDSRLQSLFLGYPSMIRGYNPGSFSASECDEFRASGSCPSSINYSAAVSPLPMPKDAFRY